MIPQQFARASFVVTVAIFALETLFLRYYRWLAIENAKVLDIPLILSIASHREVVKGVLFAVIVFALIIIKFILDSRSLKTFTAYKTAKFNWLLQIISFMFLLFLLWFTSSQQFVEFIKVNGDAVSVIHFLGSTVFIFGWAFILCASLLVIAPFNFWQKLARTQIKSLLIATLGVVLYASNQLYLSKFEVFWSGLILQPTILLAKTFARIIGLKTINHNNPQHFGTADFVVDIGPTCLGYQGVSIILIVLSAYFLIQRKYLRFPNVLLLFPISILILLLLNAFRISVLVSIGHWWSPEVAVTGFHSTAGWVELLLTLFGILWFTSSSRWLVKNVRKKSQLRLHREEFWLIPQLALIATSFVTTMFTGNFNWAYPIPIAIAIAAIWKIRNILPSIKVDNFAYPLIAGIAVFVFWIYAIPVDPKASNIFDDQIFSFPIALMVLWLIFRVAGSSIVVPIVEELAFRGFLWKYLETNLRDKLDARLIPYFTLITSSIIFGIFHSNWFAAFCAGLVYGLLYLFSRSLINTILAHAVTNFLISIYVLSTNHWSYW